MSEMQSRSLPKFETTILSPFTQTFKSLFCFLQAKGKYSIQKTFVYNVNKCGGQGGRVGLMEQKGTGRQRHFAVFETDAFETFIKA